MVTVIKNLHSKIQTTGIHKIASYTQTAWLFQPNFTIYIFEAMIFQMKQKKINFEK